MSIQLTQQQMQALGLDQATQAARDDMVFKIGKGVFDTAMARLLADLSEEQIYALNYAIENSDSLESVMRYVKKTYPGFNDYLRAEQERFTAAFVEHLQNV